MRMIPSQPLGTGSKAEKRTFDRLRAAFSGSDQNAWFAMHSLSLPRHEYKRFGEIDFVVCGPEGLFVLEVKGGGVSCHDGVWETTDRYGKTPAIAGVTVQTSGGGVAWFAGKASRFPL